METSDIKKIAGIIAEEISLYNKEVLTSAEVSKYLDMPLSTLYKLTMSGAIPHYKPTGKIIYFNREEVKRWAMQNRVSTDKEIAEKAAHYCISGGIKG